MIKITIKNLDLITKWLDNEKKRKDNWMFYNDNFWKSNIYSRYIWYKTEYIFNKVIKEAKETDISCAYDFLLKWHKIDVKACNIYTNSIPFSYYLKEKHLKNEIDLCLFFYFEWKIKKVYYLNQKYLKENSKKVEWKWVDNYKINLRNLDKKYDKTYIFTKKWL